MEYFLSYYKDGHHNKDVGINLCPRSDNLHDYYNKYNEQVSQIITKAIESTKDIDDLCL